MVTSQTTIAQNKAIYQRFIDEVFNQGKLDLVDELLSPSYVLHDAAPGRPEGPEAVRQVVTMFRAAFPDLQITLEALICEGDLVSARSTMRGTHKGAVFGVEPTGRKVSVPGLTMVRIEDGRVAESWVKNDTMAMMSQLGGGAPGAPAARGN